ncbi:MAG: Gfo/Idh/MocA family oxidoreductase [Planctomycetota bacterium]|nr:Gfo/Idh/MocA family oxidoreductase [Planctomycetota bacterium]
MHPLTFGMIGGGQGAFIGAVHRIAASLDGHARFVAGALSSSPERALESARALGLPLDRAYSTWQAMLAAEKARPDPVDFVSIVTPNHAHYEPAKAFADAGFHVVLDKPMAMNSQQADDLVRTVDRTGVVFAITYNYTGYPLVKHAAEIIRRGDLGSVRKIHVEYHQGWLATPLEASGQKQASWRTNPALAGAGALGDIGSHAENLVSTITGLSIESLCADVSTFVPGRTIDDDASVLLRLAGGARAVLTCSQVCLGEENNLSIRVYAERGSLRWQQENPNVLSLTDAAGATRLITRAGPGASDTAARATRLPAGHPEGFYEAFANIYRGVIDAIRARREGRSPGGLASEFPTVRDGARGVRFIERCLASRGQWVPFVPTP